MSARKPASRKLTYAHHLSNKDEDWELRQKAMKELQDLATSTEVDAFASLFDSKLQLALINQLKDLRSQIFREACKTISMIISVVNNNINSFPIAALPVLFIGLQNTKQVFSQSAHQCILSIIKHVSFKTVVPLLVEASGSQHPMLRAKCAGYIWMCLHSTSTQEIVASGLLPSIERELVFRLADANQEVRKLSRKSFLVFKEKLPEVADRIFLALDLPTRKQMDVTVQPSSAEKPMLKRPIQTAPTATSSPATAPASTSTPNIRNLAMKSSNTVENQPTQHPRMSLADFRRQRRRDMIAQTQPETVASSEHADNKENSEVLGISLVFSPPRAVNASNTRLESATLKDQAFDSVSPSSPIRSVALLPPMTPGGTIKSSPDHLGDEVENSSNFNSISSPNFKSHVDASIVEEIQSTAFTPSKCIESQTVCHTSDTKNEKVDEFISKVVIESSPVVEFPVETAFVVSDEAVCDEEMEEDPIPHDSRLYSFNPILSPVKESDMECSEVSMDESPAKSLFQLSTTSRKNVADQLDESVDEDDSANTTVVLREVSREAVRIMFEEEQQRRIAEHFGERELERPDINIVNKMIDVEQQRRISEWEATPAEIVQSDRSKLLQLIENERMLRIQEFNSLPEVMNSEISSSELSKLCDIERERRTKEFESLPEEERSAFEVTNALAEKERQRLMDAYAIEIEENLSASAISEMVELERARLLLDDSVPSPIKDTNHSFEAERARRIAEEALEYFPETAPQLIDALVEEERSRRVADEAIRYATPTQATRGLTEAERRRRISLDRLVVLRQAIDEIISLEESERNNRVSSQSVIVEHTTPSRIIKATEDERKRRIEEESIQISYNLSPSKITAMVEAERNQRISDEAIIEERADIELINQAVEQRRRSLIARIGPDEEFTSTRAEVSALVEEERSRLLSQDYAATPMKQVANSRTVLMSFLAHLGLFEDIHVTHDLMDELDAAQDTSLEHATETYYVADVTIPKESEEIYNARESEEIYNAEESEEIYDAEELVEAEELNDEELDNLTLFEREIQRMSESEPENYDETYDELVDEDDIAPIRGGPEPTMIENSDLNLEGHSRNQVSDQFESQASCSSTEDIAERFHIIDNEIVNEAEVANSEPVIETSKPSIEYQVDHDDVDADIEVALEYNILDALPLDTEKYPNSEAELEKAPEVVETAESALEVSDADQVDGIIVESQEANEVVNATTEIALETKIEEKAEDEIQTEADEIISADQSSQDEPYHELRSHQGGEVVITGVSSAQQGDEDDTDEHDNQGDIEVSLESDRQVDVESDREDIQGDAEVSLESDRQVDVESDREETLEDEANQTIADQSTANENVMPEETAVRIVAAPQRRSRRTAAMASKPIATRRTTRRNAIEEATPPEDSQNEDAKNRNEEQQVVDSDDEATKHADFVDESKKEPALRELPKRRGRGQRRKAEEPVESEVPKTEDNTQLEPEEAEGPKVTTRRTRATRAPAVKAGASSDKENTGVTTRRRGDRATGLRVKEEASASTQPKRTLRARTVKQ